MHNHGKLAKIHDVRTTHQDNIVFNCTFVNNDNVAKVLDYTSNRNSEVLKAGNMYYLIVDSFNIPNNTLPIFIFNNDPVGVEDIVQTSIIPITEFRPLRITIEYDDGNKYTAAIPFIDYGDLEQQTRQGDPSNKVYQIEQFIEMINTTFINLTTAAGVVNVDAYTPRIDISGDGNNIFELVIPANPTVTDPLIIENGIRFSSQLYEYFNGLFARFNGTYNSLQAEDFTLISAAQNPTTDVSIFQEHHSIYNWSDIRAILLVSSDLPVNEENFTNFVQNGNDSKLKVIADFVPFQKEDGNVDRTDWRYNSDFPRLIDLKSNRGIINISFTVQILRRDNSVSRLFISPGKAATLKMRFVKRALYNNEYNLTDLTDRINQFGVRNQHTKY